MVAALSQRQFKIVVVANVRVCQLAEQLSGEHGKSPTTQHQSEFQAIIDYPRCYVSATITQSVEALSSDVYFIRQFGPCVTTPARRSATGSGKRAFAEIGLLCLVIVYAKYGYHAFIQDGQS